MLRPGHFRAIPGRWVSASRVLQGLAGCVAMLALAGAGARTPPVADARPNVVLVTLDTTHADRLGCYGRADAGTPSLDRLAARGVRFADAWSVAPITLPAHLSMMTGCMPITHGVRDNGGAKFDGRIPTLAARFSAGGYRTAAVVSAPVLQSDWGMNAGFKVYDERWISSSIAATQLGGRPGVVPKPMTASQPPQTTCADARTPDPSALPAAGPIASAA